MRQQDKLLDTKLYMKYNNTEFYSNWLSKNMSKYRALEAAKRTIRNIKGWDDPNFWAALILLDGLD